MRLTEMLRKYEARVVVEVAPANPTMIVAAPVSLLGGRIFVDEIDVGSLWPDVIDKKHWLIRLFSRRAPRFERVAGGAVLQPGTYLVRIEKSGYEPIEKYITIGKKPEELRIEEADVRSRND